MHSDLTRTHTNITNIPNLYRNLQVWSGLWNVKKLPLGLFCCLCRPCAMSFFAFLLPLLAVNWWFWAMYRCTLQIRKQYHQKAWGLGAPKQVLYLQGSPYSVLFVSSGYTTETCQLQLTDLYASCPWKTSVEQTPSPVSSGHSWPMEYIKYALNPTININNTSIKPLFGYS